MRLNSLRVLVLHPSDTAVRALAPFLAGAAVRTRHPGGAWDVLVRWGYADGPDAPYTLNPSWALVHAAEPAAARALLQLNGVRCLTESTTKRLSTRSVVALRIHAVDLCTVAIQLVGDERCPCATSRAARAETVAPGCRRWNTSAPSMSWWQPPATIRAPGRPPPLLR